MSTKNTPLTSVPSASGQAPLKLRDRLNTLRPLLRGDTVPVGLQAPQLLKLIAPLALSVIVTRGAAPNLEMPLSV